MPITNRFSTTTNGALAITGNTLGLSKISNQNRAGTIGAIGAFITTNTALQVPTFPAGTTLTYTQNSSTAILNILLVALFFTQNSFGVETIYLATKHYECSR